MIKTTLAVSLCFFGFFFQSILQMLQMLSPLHLCLPCEQSSSFKHAVKHQTRYWHVQLTIFRLSNLTQSFRHCLTVSLSPLYLTSGLIRIKIPCVAVTCVTWSWICVHEHIIPLVAQQCEHFVFTELLLFLLLFWRHEGTLNVLFIFPLHSSHYGCSHMKTEMRVWCSRAKNKASDQKHVQFKNHNQNNVVPGLSSSAHLWPVQQITDSNLKGEFSRSCCSHEPFIWNLTLSRIMHYVNIRYFRGITPG